MKATVTIQIVIGVFLIVLVCTSLNSETRADDRLDRADVCEIIRSGKDVLPRLEKIADREHLFGDALHLAFSTIAKIRFEKKQYKKCMETCFRFLQEFRPDTYVRTLDKYVLVGDCHKNLANDAAAQTAYLRVFYHFNDYDYAYSAMRKKLVKRLAYKIRKSKWDGKEYDIPVFPTAKEQLAFASSGEKIIAKEKDVGSVRLAKLGGTNRDFPKARAYNIGLVAAAYRATTELFPEDKAAAKEARKGFEASVSRQRALLAALEATIKDRKAKRSKRYRSVQWLGNIGGDMVVAILRKAQPIQFQFSDHDIVGNVMRRLGIEKRLKG